CRSPRRRGRRVSRGTGVSAAAPRGAARRRAAQAPRRRRRSLDRSWLLLLAAGLDGPLRDQRRAVVRTPRANALLAAPAEAGQLVVDVVDDRADGGEFLVAGEAYGPA